MNPGRTKDAFLSVSQIAHIVDTDDGLNAVVTMKDGREFTVPQSAGDCYERIFEHADAVPDDPFVQFKVRH